MGFCTDAEYKEFMRTCPQFERILQGSGILLLKYWLSVSDAEQERRFKARMKNPAKRWKLSPVDLVLVEGFKRDAFPKLEIHRVANGKPLLQPADPHIIAIACDTPLPDAAVPVIDLNDIEGIVDVLLKHAVPLQKAAAAMQRA